MWQRLVGLIVVGAAALWADTCQGLPPAPSEAKIANSSSSVFRLSIKPQGPAFRITIRKTFTGSRPTGDLVRASEIEVASCKDGQRLQLLPIVARQDIDFARSFHAQDVNFDGYVDFAVLGEYGGAWGSERWWVYDATTGVFVENELTHGLMELKSAELHIDPRKHQISARYLTEPSGCGSTRDLYGVANNRLVTLHKEAPKAGVARKPELSACRVIVSDLVDGTMRVTAVRQFVDGIRVK